jgi:hypothetical protein
MTQEIESVKPILTVIDDDGDLVLSSTGPKGKAMAQAVLALANGTRKVTIVQDGEMKVLKRSGNGVEANSPQANQAAPTPRRPVSPALPSGPDIQDSFVSDLESGRTGEQAMGEVPTPTPGPSDPVPIPARRKPQIFQDAAAPPAPELVEAEMDRLLAEAQQAEADAAKAAEDQRFQAQQAIQAGQDPPTEAETAKPSPRKREPRALATSGRPCGRCGGGGQVMGEAGFQGACPVCHGEGTVKTWDRGLKVR